MALTSVPNNPHNKMPITTLKRCQHNPEWWYTVEDCFAEVLEEPETGLHIKYHNSHCKEGKMQLSVCIEDALLIRDAINQLYPPEVYPAK
jgi:hypothetical protein